MGDLPTYWDEAQNAEQSSLPILSSFSSYVATYLERDVRQMLQVRSLRHFNRCLQLLTLHNGQLLSPPAVAAEVGVSVVTIASGWGCWRVPT